MQSGDDTGGDMSGATTYSDRSTMKRPPQYVPVKRASKIRSKVVISVILEISVRWGNQPAGIDSAAVSRHQSGAPQNGIVESPSKDYNEASFLPEASSSDG